MLHSVLKFIARLERFSQRVWYTPAIALLAGLDLFILIVPTDALLISNAALRPKRWVWIALWVTAGSALGALVLGLAVQTFGTHFLSVVGFNPESSSGWRSAAQWIRDYQGLALAVFALGPFPLQPAVVLATIAGVSPWSLFCWVYLGRVIKFLFFAWAATHAPGLLSRLWGVKKEVEVLTAVQREVRDGDTD